MLKLALICLASFLLLSGCGTPGPAQQTSLLGARDQPRLCPLVACPLPGRLAPSVNEDLTTAIDDTEAALLSCAAQVLDCIQKQDAAAGVSSGVVGAN